MLRLTQFGQGHASILDIVHHVTCKSSVSQPFNCTAPCRAPNFDFTVLSPHSLRPGRVNPRMSAAHRYVCVRAQTYAVLHTYHIATPDQSSKPMHSSPSLASQVLSRPPLAHSTRMQSGSEIGSPLAPYSQYCSSHQIKTMPRTVSRPRLACPPNPYSGTWPWQVGSATATGRPSTTAGCAIGTGCISVLPE